MDVLAANQLGRAVFAPLFASAQRPVNIARFIFLDPAARDFYRDWDTLAADTVAHTARRGRPRPVRPGTVRSGR